MAREHRASRHNYRMRSVREGAARLVPTLLPNDIVEPDDVGSHESQDARRSIRGAGESLLFLPLYGPDLSPVEQMFARLRHPLREAAPRRVDATWRRIGVK